MTSITTIAAPAQDLGGRQLPRPLRLAAYGAALLVIDLVVAVGLVDKRFAVLLLLLIAALAAVLVFRLPMTIFFALLGFTDFIFYPSLFAFSVGPVDARPFELALLGLLSVAVLRPRNDTWGGKTGLALAAFLLLVALSGVLAVIAGEAPLTDVFNTARPLALLTVFYVVIRVFPSAEQRKALLLGSAVIASIAGFVALLVSLGWSVGDTLKGSGTQIIREEEGVGGVFRVRLAGLSLGYALFWYVVVQVSSTHGGRRLAWTALFTGIAIAIVVSFNRNMWIGLAAGLLLMMIMGGAFVRGKLVVAGIVSMAAIALLASIGSATDSRLVEPVVQRGATIFNPTEVSQSGSISDRQEETSVAWETAKDHPLLGVGAGVDFGVSSLDYLGPNSIVVTPQLFLHNQYLYLLLIAGVPGLIAFLIFLGAPMVRAFGRTPRDPLVTACGVGIAMIMISSVVAIYFTVEDMTVALGLLTGVIIADAETRATEGRESGLGS